ncbi:hypothetical protein KCU79_g14444, partial [Aureobasidium melanogenum]
AAVTAFARAEGTPAERVPLVFGRLASFKDNTERTALGYGNNSNDPEAAHNTTLANLANNTDAGAKGVKMGIVCSGYADAKELKDASATVRD